MDLWRKNLYVLWATQFIAMVGMNLVVPFLPFYIRQLGVTNDAEVVRWSGLVFAGPFVSSFFATPIWGNLGDRYGRKPMVIRALFGLALSQVLIGFSQNVMQVFLFRIFQGAISGFIALGPMRARQRRPPVPNGISRQKLSSSSRESSLAMAGSLRSAAAPTNATIA